MRRHLSIVLSAMLLISCMPAVAFASNLSPDDFTITISTENYDNQFQITPDNCNGAGWSFDYSTLTMRIENLSADAIWIETYVENSEEFKLIVKGTSSINDISAGRLNITGDGELNCAGVDIASLRLSGDVVFTTESRAWLTYLNMTDNAIYRNTRGNSHGIDVLKEALIEDNAKLSSRSINWKDYSAAIYLGDGQMIVKDNAEVIAESGTAKTDGGKSVAIYAKKGITVMDNASVTATSKKAKNMSIAICSDAGDVNVYGGTVIAKSADVYGKENKKNKNLQSNGLYSWKKDVNITGGTVYAQCGKSCLSNAIYAAKGSVSITGGNISAVGGVKKYKAKKDSVSSGINGSKAIKITNAIINTEGYGKYNSYGVFCKKKAPEISGTCTLVAYGEKAAFNKKPTVKNCSQEIRAGKSEATAKTVTASKKTYTKNKYVLMNTIAS